MRSDKTAINGGKIIAVGFGMGFLFNTLMQVFKGWKEVPGKQFEAPFKGGSFSLDASEAVVGLDHKLTPKKIDLSPMGAPGPTGVVRATNGRARDHRRFQKGPVSPIDASSDSVSSTVRRRHAGSRRSGEYQAWAS